MIFDEELTLLKEKIANAEDVDELNYIRTTRGCDAKFLVVFCVFNFLIIFSYFSCFLCLFRCIFFLGCVRLCIV